MRTVTLGISMLAVAASSAAAQTTVSGANNKSTIDITGPHNTVTVDNAQPGNENNVSKVVQNGWYNTATVQQVGDVNDAEVSQNGSYNQAHYGQFGNDNIVRSSQVHDKHYSKAEQQGDRNVLHMTQTGGWTNASTVTQTGKDNLVSSRQSGNRNVSELLQTGNRNRAVVVQTSGDDNRSTIEQHIDPRIVITGNRHASVEQHGSGNQSSVRQVHWDNVATLVQGTPDLLSQNNYSIISQRSAGNTARVQMLGYGSEQSRQNNSEIIQQHIDPITTNSVADVSISGSGNRSHLTQTGGLHVARVSIAGGGIGIDRTLGRELLNQSFVWQWGNTGHYAQVAIGGSSPERATANEVWIDQKGHHPTVQNHAQLSLQGRGGRVNVTQRINDGDQGGARAEIAQSGRLGRINVHQTGRNLAAITQTGGGEAYLMQSSGSVSDAAPAPGTSYRGNNSFSINQNGLGAVSGQQVGSDNQATVTQKSYNGRVVINQGSHQSASHGSSASVTQGEWDSAEINQNGLRHAAAIEQLGNGTFSSGPGRIAEVRQTGASGNSASIRQTETSGPSAAGDPASGNSASQNQAETLNTSAPADEYYFAGGERSAEARIFQAGSNSTATIEQRGRGQFARIEQRGDGNQAMILQDVAATNATAVIQQDGNGNSYSVTQNQPGQYIHVRQTGTNNSVNTVVQRGPAS